MSELKDNAEYLTLYILWVYSAFECLYFIVKSVYFILETRGPGWRIHGGVEDTKFSAYFIFKSAYFIFKSAYFIFSLCVLLITLYYVRAHRQRSTLYYFI